MGATDNDPSALVEVAESSVHQRSTSVFNPLSNVLGRLQGPRPVKQTSASGGNPVELIGRVPTSDLSKQPRKLRGRVQSGLERWTLGRGQSAALATALVSTLATSTPALAAGPSPWAYSTFLDAIQSGSVERVSFAADGKTALALDTDANRHEA